MKKLLLTILSLMIISMTVLSTGCMKPFDKPEYKDIKPSETAYLIKLEGVSNQAKFDSMSYLDKNKVAAKRVQITHRWNQTGRLLTSGAWIPDVMLITVDRSPVTVSWEFTENPNDKDNAIWTESSDSVGMSLGWNITAYIREEDTSTFLYMYPSGSLKNVIDTEVHARIQQVSAEFMAQYKMDILREKKKELALAVQTNIVPFFCYSRYYYYYSWDVWGFYV